MLCLILRLLPISVIDEEKKETRAEVKTFDQSKLKHVETVEKSAPPTAEGKTTPPTETTPVSTTDTSSIQPSTTESSNHEPKTPPPKKSCVIL